MVAKRPFNQLPISPDLAKLKPFEGAAYSERSRKRYPYLKEPTHRIYRLHASQRRLFGIFSETGIESEEVSQKSKKASRRKNPCRSELSEDIIVGKFGSKHVYRYSF